MATLGLSACATDQPSAAIDLRPAMLAVHAVVPRTNVTAGPAAVRITVAYRKAGGAVAPLGAPQLFNLDQSTQQVPIAVDVATCLADAGRAGTNGAAPAADECNIQLTLEFLLNGVRVDQQVISNLSVRPGRTSTVEQPVALAQVADVKLVLPSANQQAGSLRLERGATMTLGVQVIDANGQTITGREVTWTSSNPAVATVSQTGVVTGVGLGIVELTATVAGRDIPVSVSVVVPSQLITVASAGVSGRGDVVSNPAGIACFVQGAQTSGVCSASFPGDAPVRLIATPAAPGEFLNFSGDCASTTDGVCTIAAPQAPRRVSVTFRGRQSLVVAGAGTGTGTVTTSVGGVACTVTSTSATGTCTALIAEGASVQLNAVATGTSVFMGWTGDCAAFTGPTCTIGMDRTRTASARFSGLSAVTVRGGGTGSGTVSSSPTGIACAVTGGAATGSCSSNFADGMVVRLAAVAGTGSEFEGWTGGCTGAGPCNVIVGETPAVQANFRQTSFPLTLTVAGPIGAFVSTSTGQSCNTNGSANTCTFFYAPGTTVRLTATTNAQLQFAGFSGSCAGSGVCDVIMSSARSVSATFEVRQAALRVNTAGVGLGTVSSSPGGISCTSGGNGPCSAVFALGSQVSLTASPATGSTFDGWSGACTGTGGCTVTMNALADVTATFSRVLVPLTVTMVGPTGGTITSSTGDACSTSGVSTACTFRVPQGTTVRLSINAGAGVRFTGYSGACSGTGVCDIAMTEAKAVTATFESRNSTVQFALSGTGGGTISSDAGVSCSIAEGQGSRTCSFQIESGRRVTLSAQATSGSSFAGWSGVCSGTGSCSFAADNVTINATFQKTPPAVITVGRAPGEGGSGAVVFGPSNSRCLITMAGTSGTCSIEVLPGTSVTFSIDPSLGFPFAGWGGACASFGTSSSCTITANASLSVTARFQAPPASRGGP